jgi:hypothetical protein
VQLQLKEKVGFTEKCKGMLKEVGWKPNPALNLAPFGRWTLRDTAAQRRLALS